MGQGGSGGRYQSGLDRSGRTEIPYSVLRVRQTRGFSWPGAFGGWGVVRHGSVGRRTHGCPQRAWPWGWNPGAGPTLTLAAQGGK